MRYNSMKHQKSSCSLHSKPTLPFQEQNSNTITYHKHGLTLKRLNTNPRESTIVYNARGRLNTCITHLHELQGQVEEMNAKNKEIRVTLGFIREEYHLRKIGEIQAELSNSVKQLRKKVMIANRSDLLKFESLNQIVGSLHKTQKEIRGKVEQIEVRVYLLQNIMGSGQTLAGVGSE